MSEETLLRRELTEKYKFILKRRWQGASDVSSFMKEFDSLMEEFISKFGYKPIFSVKHLGNGRYSVHSFKPKKMFDYISLTC